MNYLRYRRYPRLTQAAERTHELVAALARQRGWHWRLLELTALKDCQHNAPKAYERADLVAAHCRQRVDEQAHAPKPRQVLGLMDALLSRLGDAWLSSSDAKWTSRPV